MESVLILHYIFVWFLISKWQEIVISLYSQRVCGEIKRSITDVQELLVVHHFPKPAQKEPFEIYIQVLPIFPQFGGSVALKTVIVDQYFSHCFSECCCSNHMDHVLKDFQWQIIIGKDCLSWDQSEFCLEEAKTSLNFDSV